MGTVVLWSVLGLVGIAGLTVGLIIGLRWLDKLLLRAEEKGWIYYRKKSAGGIVSSGVAGAMNELDRIVRPSAEYRIEAESPIVEEDEKGGE